MRYELLKMVNVMARVIFAVGIFGVGSAEARVNCRSSAIEADRMICTDAALMKLDKKLDDFLKKALKTPFVNKADVMRQFEAWWLYRRPYKDAWIPSTADKERIKLNYRMEITALGFIGGHNWKPVYAFFQDDDLLYGKDAGCQALLDILNKTKYAVPYAWEGLPFDKMGPDFQAVQWRPATPDEYATAVSEEVLHLDYKFWSYYVMLNKPASWSGEGEQFKMVDKTLYVDLIRGKQGSASIAGSDIFTYKGAYYTYTWGMRPWLSVWRLNEQGEVLKPEIGTRGMPWCQIATDPIDAKVIN